MFDKFINLKNLVSYKKFLIVLLIISFLIALTYIYFKYIKKNTETLINNNDNKTSDINANDNKIADLYFFYTDWCPHCKKTKPEWEKLKQNYENKNQINGYTLNFISVDCEANPELANKFKIEGYPTIKLVKNNQIIEFDAKPEVNTLQQFINNVLSQ